MNNIKRLQFLGNMDFFTHLRGALNTVGIPSELLDIAIGIYAVIASRSLPHPLRMAFPSIRDTTGPAVEAVAQLFKPGSCVTVDPGKQEHWDAFATSPGDKVLFIPRWIAMLPNGGYAYLEIQNNTLIRVLGTKTFDETTDAITGNFACISSEALPPYRVASRWLNLKPSAISKADLSSKGLTPAEKATWHEVDFLLTHIAQLPVALPKWQQLAIEQVCEKGKKAGLVVPVLLQAWRTLAVLRSFRYDLQVEKLKPSFADLAATTMAFPKTLYAEASSFPSAQQVFNLISRPGESDGVQHPLTGKGRRYRHKLEPLKLQPIIGLNAEFDNHGGVTLLRDRVRSEELYPTDGGA